MKNTCVILCAVVLICLLVGGCSQSSEYFYLQDRMLVLSNIQARPNPVNPGAIIVFAIDLLNLPGRFSEGTIIVNDSQGNSYQGDICNAQEKEVTNALVASITLSPLVPPGELLLEVFVLDPAGNASNTGFVTVTVL